MNNKLLITILLTSIFLTTIVYSAFSTQLNIEGEAIVRSDQEIRVTNISVKSSSNGSYETYNNKYNKDTTFMYVTLLSNSSITYEVEITNKENNSYLIDLITQESHTNSNVNVDISLKENDIVESNNTKKFTITLTNNTSSEQQETLVYKYGFKLNKFIVSFDANGGSVSQTSKEVSYGNSYGTLPTPTRAGYKFLGWNGANYFNYENVNDSQMNSDNDGFITVDTSVVREYYRYFTSNLDVKINTMYNAFIEVKETRNLTGILFLTSGHDVGGSSNTQFLGKYIVSDSLHNGVLKYDITTYDGIATENTGLRTFYYNPNRKNDELLTFRLSVLDKDDSITQDSFKYEPYYITSSTTVVQSNNHTLKAMWEKAQWDYNYTGNVQELTVPMTGTYKIELWGASGEDYSVSNSIDPGLGGYVSGQINLSKNNKLYVYVGGNENLTYTNSSKFLTFNGGGAGQTSGGGATDIRLQTSTNWYDFSSLKSRIIVAAGGGGGFTNFSISDKVLGNAGGLDGYGASCTYFPESNNLKYYSDGGTQTNGGIGGRGSTYNGNDRTNANGRFGYGGYAFDTRSSKYYPIASGGGGGYYGGGYGTHPGNGYTGGAGGSSFISGYSGCDAIDEASTENNIINTGQANHYSGKVFTNGVMIDGAGCNWSTGTATNCGANQIQPDGTYATGHTGNGYARITFIE